MSKRLCKAVAVLLVLSYIIMAIPVESFALEQENSTNAIEQDQCRGGQAFADSYYNTPLHGNWTADRAFDDNGNSDFSTWHSAINTNQRWIAYKFSSPKRIQRVEMLTREHFAGGRGFKNFKIQGSNDSTNGKDGTWTDLAVGLSCSGEEKWDVFNFNNAKAYETIRIIGESLEPSGCVSIGEIKIMETQSGPPIQRIDEDECISGQAFADSYYNTPLHGNWTADRAFDDNGNSDFSTWHSAINTNQRWIAYKFSSPKKIQRVEMLTREYYAGGRGFKNFKIQGSNDSTNGKDGTWTDLAVGLSCSGEEKWDVFNFDNTQAYETIRIIGKSLESSGCVSIGEIKMMETQSGPPIQRIDEDECISGQAFADSYYNTPLHGNWTADRAFDDNGNSDFSTWHSAINTNQLGLLTNLVLRRKSKELKCL